jgi:hypothetical protein
MASKRSHALRARERGLRRISIATRSLVVVSVGAAGVFSAIAARAQSGHAKVVRARAAGRGLAFPSPNSAPPTSAATSAGSDDQTPASLAPPPTLPAAGSQYDPTPVVTGAT